MAETIKGTVKWFNDKKGYGFISRETGGDLFVHVNDILGEGYKTLTENQSVEFEVGTGTKGPAAKNVNPL